jgi:hypothetical protein
MVTSKGIGEGLAIYLFYRIGHSFVDGIERNSIWNSFSDRVHRRRSVRSRIGN